MSLLLKHQANMWYIIYIVNLTPRKIKLFRGSSKFNILKTLFTKIIKMYVS